MHDSQAGKEFTTAHLRIRSSANPLLMTSSECHTMDIRRSSLEFTDAVSTP